MVCDVDWDEHWRLCDSRKKERSIKSVCLCVCVYAVMVMPWAPLFCLICQLYCIFEMYSHSLLYRRKDPSQKKYIYRRKDSDVRLCIYRSNRLNPNFPREQFLANFAATALAHISFFTMRRFRFQSSNKNTYFSFTQKNLVFKIFLFFNFFIFFSFTQKNLVFKIFLFFTSLFFLKEGGGFL